MSKANPYQPLNLEPLNPGTVNLLLHFCNVGGN